MTRPRLTVGEVIRSCLDEFIEEYGASLTPEQRRAPKDLASCRTAALGEHVLGCAECGHRQFVIRREGGDYLGHLKRPSRGSGRGFPAPSRGKWAKVVEIAGRERLRDERQGFETGAEAVPEFRWVGEDPQGASRAGD